MRKKTSVVKVGKLTENFCKKYGITDGMGFDIVQSIGLVYHVQKHTSNFLNLNNYTDALSNISKVIASPIFVYFDSARNSIRFYKKLQQYVCVVVNIDKTVAHVATVYPINKKKIDRLKQKVENSKIVS